MPAPALGLGEFGESEQKPGKAIHIIFVLQFSPSCGDHKGGGDGGQTGFILFFILHGPHSLKSALQPERTKLP